ncbi:MAG: DUF302 domain-containing protein [Gammaproteobacteria bacterium]|nr:DUF302 domain-containing protein [Gammaproteobacteria bacterium]
MRSIQGLIALGFLAMSTITFADASMLYVKSVPGNFEKTYKRVFSTLENNGYYVIFEPNVGKNLANFKNRWGENYNKNKLEDIRSMIFCNANYANEMGNLDPAMLALCPLHLTLIHKEGVTQILLVRPSLVAAGSPAEPVALELEQDVIRTVESAVKDGTPTPAAPIPTAPPSSSRE